MNANNNMKFDAIVTMRAWPVARSIFDAPLLCERSERADDKLDNAIDIILQFAIVLVVMS